jgi:hypothetical protein
MLNRCGDIHGGSDTAPIGHVHRRQDRRGRSPHAAHSPLTNKLESKTLPDRMTQALDPGTARGVFAIFEDLCLLS